MNDYYNFQKHNLEDRSAINSDNKDSENIVMDGINLAVSKCLHIPVNSVDYNLSIKQLGFDSITYVEFIVELEASLNLNFEENVLAMDNFENLIQLYTYVLSLTEK